MPRTGWFTGEESSALAMSIQSGSSLISGERQPDIRTGILDNRDGGRRTASTRGNTLVESAIVISLFFFLMFAVVDMATLFYAQTTLQDAVREAGRYAITGNHQQDPGNPGQQLSRVNSIIAVARQAAMGLNISSIQVSSISGGNGSAGGPGDTVTVSLTSSVPLLTPFFSQMFHGAFTFTVSTRFKNESFPPGQTN